MSSHHHFHLLGQEIIIIMFVVLMILTLLLEQKLACRSPPSPCDISSGVNFDKIVVAPEKDDFKNVEDGQAEFALLGGEWSNVVHHFLQALFPLIEKFPT